MNRYVGLREVGIFGKQKIQGKPYVKDNLGYLILHLLFFKIHTNIEMFQGKSEKQYL